MLQVVATMDAWIQHIMETGVSLWISLSVHLRHQLQDQLKDLPLQFLHTKRKAPPTTGCFGSLKCPDCGIELKSEGLAFDFCLHDGKCARPYWRTEVQSMLVA